MARGFGLRARLIGGGGGGQVGFGSGVAQGLSNIAAQIVAQNDPDIQMARQLQGLKIQAAQRQLEAQQEEQQTMAGYRQLGEEAFPTGGRTQEIDLGGQEPEQAPVTMPQTTPLSLNDRLQKALIQSGNLRAIQAIQAQQLQQEPATVVDLGGGQRGIRQPGGNITALPTIQTKEPREQEEIRNVYAMSQYHLPFAQLQPDQQMDVLKTIESHKGETAVAQAVNRQTALMPGMLAAASAKRGEQPAPPRLYLDQTGQEQHPGTTDEAKGLVALPISSPAAKTHTASNMVYNHIALGIDNLNGIASGDRNRLIQNLDNKISVFKNDPSAVALFHFLGPATAVALSNAYAANSAGMRGGARLAMIMRSAGIEEGDTLRTAIQSKLLPLAKLNLANVRDAGLPTQKYEEQIKALTGILQATPTVTLGGQTYRRQ